ncbi:MAG: hypothetical protein JAZ02_03090 [Candidatus Thiodiazotropha endolucinida]|nr:hypothetical protein [Candidatus Thiodiazotropha sp. (ex Lucina pensylvanica)]MCG8022959.1 hypothetical protein [Candidatus Thiodiazotropha endolucinida]
MSRTKITKQNIQRIKQELDRWEGKFSVQKFADHVASVLGIDGLDRTTLYQYRAELGDRIEAARQRYRDSKAEKNFGVPEDVQLADALKKIEALNNEVASLKKDLAKHRYKIIQILYNAYFHKIDPTELSNPVDEREAETLLARPDVQKEIHVLDQPMPPAKK